MATGRLLPLIIAASLALAGAFTACRRGQTPNPEAVERSLLEVDREWSNAAAAKDWERFYSYYTADATMLPPGAPMATGIDAIRKTFQPFASNPTFSLKWQVAKAQAARSAEMGYTLGAYEMAFHDPAGKPVNDRGKYVTIWRKQPDGKWKAAVDMFNSDLPPPGASQ
jgi:uncharacterized protein (TIGR02246 family)